MTIKVSKTRLDFGTIGMRNYAESVNALGNVSGTVNIDYSAGSVVTATSVGDTVWNVLNAAASGKTSSFILVLTNGGTYVQTWFSGTKWPYDSAPTLTASGVDVFTFFSTDGGATWRGVLAMKDSR